MMGVWAGRCLLEPVYDHSPWWRRAIWPPILFRVAEPFQYICDYGTVTIDRGFLTDGASVPRPLRWLFPSVGNYLRAAIVHDAALTSKPRRIANRIFLNAMLDDGVKPVVARILFTAVEAYATMKEWRSE